MYNILLFMITKTPLAQCVDMANIHACILSLATRKMRHPILVHDYRHMALCNFATTTSTPQVAPIGPRPQAFCQNLSSSNASSACTTNVSGMAARVIFSNPSTACKTKILQAQLCVVQRAYRWATQLKWMLYFLVVEQHQARFGSHPTAQEARQL